MVGKRHRPPFEISSQALASAAEIMRWVGRYEGIVAPKPQPKLRRQNQIRTIRGSLAIEGNTLSEEQMTAILDGKRVLGPKREIVEVQNAIETYARVAELDPAKERDLLGAHGRLMRGLVDDAGRYRRGGVGVVRGSRVAHMAPPANQVERLVRDLLSFTGQNVETHPLVRSAVVHYELEFIHPFSDGNGRIGRLWQHVVLVHYHPIFEFVPIESVIQEKQQEYYRVLALCDRAGSSTAFIEFSLSAIEEALAGFLAELRPAAATAESRLEAAREHFGSMDFSRRDYLALFKTISTATASRDLKEGVVERLLTQKGEKALTRYKFK